MWEEAPSLICAAREKKEILLQILSEVVQWIQGKWWAAHTKQLWSCVHFMGRHKAESQKKALRTHLCLNLANYYLKMSTIKRIQHRWLLQVQEGKL